MGIRSQSFGRLRAVSVRDLEPHVATFHATLLEIQAALVPQTGPTFEPTWLQLLRRSRWFLLATFSGACVFIGTRLWARSDTSFLSATMVSTVLTAVGGAVAIFGNTVDSRFRWRVTPVGLFAALVFLSTTQVTSRREQEERREHQQASQSLAQLNGQLGTAADGLQKLSDALARNGKSLENKYNDIDQRIQAFQGTLGNDDSGVIHELHELPASLPKKIAAAVQPSLPTADGIAEAVAKKDSITEGIKTKVATDSFAASIASRVKVPSLNEALLASNLEQTVKQSQDYQNAKAVIANLLQRLNKLEAELHPQPSGAGGGTGAVGGSGGTGG